jgi:hypothetical protein
MTTKESAIVNDAQRPPTVNITKAPVIVNVARRLASNESVIQFFWRTP